MFNGMWLALSYASVYPNSQQSKRVGCHYFHLTWTITTKSPSSDLGRGCDQMKVLIPKAIAVLILSLLAINGNTLLAVAQRPYTARDILDRIEANGGPEELDLSGMDLRGIDLSRETIQAELEQEKEDDQRAKPKWVSDLTDGINLRGINLRRATLGEANLQYA